MEALGEALLQGMSSATIITTTATSSNSTTILLLMIIAITEHFLRTRHPYLCFLYMNSFTLYKNPRRQASGYLHLTEGAGHEGTQLAAVQVVFISRRSRARLLCCGTSNGGLGTQLTSMCTGFLQQQQRTFLVWVLPETSCHAVTPIPLVSQPLGQGSCSRGQCRCGEKQPGCVLQTFHCYHFRSVMLLAHILSVANFYLLKKLEDYIKQLEGVGFESKKLNMPPEFLMSVFE